MAAKTPYTTYILLCIRRQKWRKIQINETASFEDEHSLGWASGRCIPLLVTARPRPVPSPNATIPLYVAAGGEVKHEPIGEGVAINSPD